MSLNVTGNPDSKELPLAIAFGNTLFSQQLQRGAYRCRHHPPTLLFLLPGVDTWSQFLAAGATKSIEEALPKLGADLRRNIPTPSGSVAAVHVPHRDEAAGERAARLLEATTHATAKGRGMGRGQGGILRQRLQNGSDNGLGTMKSVSEKIGRPFGGDIRTQYQEIVYGYLSG